MRVTCPICGSDKVMKRGTRGRQRYQCTNASHPEGEPRYFRDEVSVANVVLFDIETLPGIKRFWRMGEQDWSPETIIQPGILLSYSAKRLFDSEVTSSVLTSKEAVARDDSRLAGEIWDIIHSADIIIAHNGDNFDMPWVNTRFAYHDMVPPLWPITIDTKKAASQYFYFPSNRLAALAAYFGFQPKLHTDYQLWVDCERGDKAALEYMRKYNAQDIFTLEDVYMRLRPFIRNHPNMTMYMDLGQDEVACKHCGSRDLKWGYEYTTNASVFEAFQCNHCGGFGRRKKKLRTTGTR